MGRPALHLLSIGLVGSLLVAQGVPLGADVVVPRRGKRIEGTVVVRDGPEIVVNVYFSPNPDVTNADHLVRLAAGDAKEVTIAGPPAVDFHRRLASLPPADTAGFVDLARFAESHDLDAEAALAWALALRNEPTHKDALKGIGGAAKWKALAAERIELNTAARDALDAYVNEADPAARRERVAAITASGWLRKPEELERRRRSRTEKTGLDVDRPVSWNATAHPSAVATWYVPTTYTPLHPIPLLVGLHGGGPGGKHLDEVVGSGPSAMNFYRELAERRGFLVVCPTALAAPWGRPENEQLVRDVIAEAQARFAVDPDRIHLTGHSMGGFGTWALGTRLAEMLATISPMAGAGSGVPELVKTQTPIFLYHSADDFIDVTSARTAAAALKESGLDFVYTELPDRGHDFPESIRNELFDFIAPRRRFEKRRKSAWPRSSLDGKVTPDEKRWIGDPLESWSGATPDLDARVERLARGGGCALDAAEALIAEKPAGAAPALAKLLRGAKAPPSARAEAARVLAALGDRDAASAALVRALGGEATREESVVVVAAARAAVALSDAAAIDAIEDALARWSAFHVERVVDDAAGPTMDFADWQRSLGVLVPLVEAWTALAAPKRPIAPLERHVVTAVLAPKHAVRTSDRVPQDPSIARTALGKALRGALTKAAAPEASWQRLDAALANDEAARAAARP